MAAAATPTVAFRAPPAIPVIARRQGPSVDCADFPRNVTITAVRIPPPTRISSQAVDMYFTNNAPARAPGSPVTRIQVARIQSMSFQRIISSSRAENSVTTLVE